MSKHKNPMLEALKEGKSFTWTEPDGGDMASMRGVIKHGQTLTMSPIETPGEIRVGDLVLVQWHQGIILHMVGEIQGDQYLIANGLGKVNGWVSSQAILGRITNIIEPEPNPGVPALLDQLDVAYRNLIQHEQASSEDARRLYSIVDDLRWYADRIGSERWNEMPRQNLWSFEQNLWHLTKQLKKMPSPSQNHIRSVIDSGKHCVGLASEIFSLFETIGSDQ